VDKKETSYQIRSIRRAIQILNSLYSEKAGMTLVELTKKIDMSKSTIFRIFLNLKYEGFVDKDQYSKFYIKILI